MAPLQRTAVTRELADWVHDLTFADIPARVVQRAKHILLDGFGAALVGALLPWSRVATSAVLGLEGSGDSIVIGIGRTTAAPPAVLLNSTFVQGFELDDFHPLAPLHSDSLIIPALLASARLRPSGAISGADALTAAIIGFEVGPRVGLALHGAQMFSRGWHSGAVFGTHPAAMTTGKLRRLRPGCGTPSSS
jgi:2-methylcitrate dehydratase PrpD